MKQLIILLGLVYFFSACNNTEKGKTPVRSDGDTTEKALKTAIDRFPDSLLLKETLIQYYRDSGNYDMAIALATNALEKDSNNAGIWNIKATLLVENEDTINAILSFEKALAISPEPRYFIALGRLCAETKNTRALDIADMMLKSKTVYPEKEALFIKGLFYSYAGDKQKAIGFFSNCLAIDYTFMLAYREKAIALYDAGKYEEALAVLVKAVTLQNNFDEGYYWKGRCLEKLNRVNEAIENYQTALLYDPQFVEAKEALDKLGVK